ncbi:MAG: S-layer homology domain-containing protein [Oscillospiraceae bacterium]
MKRSTRLASAALIICLIVTLLPVSASASAASHVWDGKTTSGFSSGGGTEQDPYIIKTAGELAYLAGAVNTGTSFAGEYIRLAADIILNDISGCDSWNSEAPANIWTPIGTVSNPFSGIFEGDNHAICGVYINTGDNYQGLFGCVENGAVKNAGVCSSYIAGGSYTGGIVGRSYAYSAGAAASSKVTGCSFSGTVSGTGYVGGIVGLSYAHTSYFSSTVNVSCCYNAGNVTGKSYNVGGVVGRSMANPASSSAPATAGVSECANTGDVKGGGYVGGIVGSNGAAPESSAVVKDCLNSGRVSSGNFSGGIVGQNYVSAGTTGGSAFVVTCCNTGAVTGPGTGGISGYDFAAAPGMVTVKNSYYLEGTATSGTTNGGGTGTVTVTGVNALTDDQMKLASSFEGFNFESVWEYGTLAVYSNPQLKNVRLIEKAPETPEDPTGWLCPYTDVKSTDSCYNAVKYVTENGLMNGTGSAVFEPEANLTRAMFVTILWRYAGSPVISAAARFSDVAQDSWYAAPVVWAEENDIVKGYGDGTFGPADLVSRQQAAVIFLNYSIFSGAETSLSDNSSWYSDEGDTAVWAREAVSWALASGILSLTGNALDPNGRVSRASAAEMFMLYDSGD